MEDILRRVLSDEPEPAHAVNGCRDVAVLLPCALPIIYSSSERILHIPLLQHMQQRVIGRRDEQCLILVYRRLDAGDLRALRAAEERFLALPAARYAQVAAVAGGDGAAETG